MLSLSLVVLAAAAPPPSAASDKADLQVVHRIKAEAFRGEVANHLFHLTDVNGHRLTASPGYEAAARWIVQRLGEWGTSGARLEKFPFGRRWTVKRYAAHLVEPAYAPMGGIPQAWTAGTRGAVTAELAAAPLYARDEPVDFEPGPLLERIRRWREKHKGTLRDRIVLIDEARDTGVVAAPAAARYDDKQLGEIDDAPEPNLPVPLVWPLRDLPHDPARRSRLMAQIPPEIRRELSDRMRAARNTFHVALREEGALAVFETTASRGSARYATGEGSWRADEVVPVPMVMLGAEEYGRLWRLVEKKVPAKVELQVDVESTEHAVDGLNVIAEIPGRTKKDEIVLIGAHLDSWHGATGTTDNAVGCAVMMEALRILKRLDLPLARTVRLALWGGEEQGLVGSPAYVREHLADPVTMTLKPEHETLSVYFNLDNGAGRVRGIYLNNNDMVRPIFEAWLAPFRDMGAQTVALRPTGSTDHVSFDGVGIPAFQFIQDPLEYFSKTHHSELDTYEYARPGDLMHSAAVVASFVYHAANRAEKLPRKALPPPLPPQTPVP